VFLGANLDTFCKVAPDTASRKAAVPLHRLQYRTVYHFTFTEQKAADNTTDHSRIVGLHVTLNLEAVSRFLENSLTHDLI
jgi:hypothetical protein